MLLIIVFRQIQHDRATLHQVNRLLATTTAVDGFERRGIIRQSGNSPIRIDLQEPWFFLLKPVDRDRANGVRDL